MRDRELELVLDVTDEPCHVRGDADQLERVLLNLLQNSAKFTPAGGTVTVTAAVVDADTTTLSVTDTGTGIPVAEQPYVFDRFFRGLDAHTEGTGLGLFIVKTMIERHGGSVALTSDPGTGTTVTCRLPVVRLATIAAATRRRMMTDQASR
jgi:signal transduction histidine kinase